jgi:hypothetical protein
MKGKGMKGKGEKDNSYGQRMPGACRPDSAVPDSDTSLAVMPELRTPHDVVISKMTDIQAPIEVVFDVITDFQLFVELEEGVKSVTILSDEGAGAGTDGGTGVGTRSRWVLEDQSTGAEWTLEEEVIAYDRPRSYAYVGYAGGKDYSGVHTLTENGEGSTRHQFSEAFYFDVDRRVYEEVVSGMMHNVKKEAQRRAAGNKLQQRQ